MYYGIWGENRTRLIEIARVDGVMETADGGLVAFG